MSLFRTKDITGLYNAGLSNSLRFGCCTIRQWYCCRIYHHFLFSSSFSTTSPFRSILHTRRLLNIGIAAHEGIASEAYKIGTSLRPVHRAGMNPIVHLFKTNQNCHRRVSTSGAATSGPHGGGHRPARDRVFRDHHQKRCVLRSNQPTGEEFA